MKERVVVAVFGTVLTLMWLAIPLVIGWVLYMSVHPAVSIIAGVVALFPSGWLMNKLFA